MKTLRKAVLSALALCLCGFFASAQDLAVTKVKDKFGYADPSGNVVIKADYTKAYPFENGRAKVQKGDKWGYIGTDGKPVIKIEYDNIEEFQNGLARVKKGGKYGYIKDDGTIYIKPAWNYIGTINEDGYVWVGKGKSLSQALKGLYRNDTLVVPAKFYGLGFYVATDSADYTSGNVITHKDGIPVNCEITENLAKLSCSKEPYIWANWGAYTTVFDLDGKVLVKNVNGAVGMPRDGYMLKRAYSKKGKKEYYDFNYFAANGKGTKLFKKDIRQLVDPEDVYDACGPFVNGKALCGDGSEAYLIDIYADRKSGSYSKLAPVAGGYFLSTRNGRMGILSPDGTEIVAPTYRKITPASADGTVYAAKNENHRSGFIGADGATIIPFDYDDASAFVGGKAYVKQGQFYGIIDRNGKFVVKNRWEAILPAASPDDDLVWVKSPDTQKWSVLQISTDKLPFDIAADDCYTFDSKGRALYKKDDLFGAVGSDGSAVLPLSFNTVATANRALVYIDQAGKPRMEEIDAYRFNIYNHPGINSFRLHQKISSNMWDY